MPSLILRYWRNLRNIEVCFLRRFDIMTLLYDYAVFIGRFQPFHIGHLHIFGQALEAAKTLVVLVGSSGGARSLRNPFSFDERVAMIQASLPADMSARVVFYPLQDFTYNDAMWVESVKETVNNAAGITADSPEKSIALIGHDKDETTYYLKLFPNWSYVEISNLDGINATEVRQRYFTHDLPAQFDSEILLPPTVKWLREFGKTESFIALTREYHAISKYKSAWSSTPYPVIFTTTDALVRWHDDILLIKRKDYPGKGLWALPGGFLEPDETLFSGCLRELLEETQLAVDDNTLKNSPVKHEVFDDPKRSTRGRVITHCYYFDISRLPERPEVQAAGDAQYAEWVSIDTVARNKMFEDHYFIIQSLLQEQTL